MQTAKCDSCGQPAAVKRLGSFEEIVCPSCGYEKLSTVYDADMLKYMDSAPTRVQLLLEWSELPPPPHELAEAREVFEYLFEAPDNGPFAKVQTSRRVDLGSYLSIVAEQLEREAVQRGLKVVLE